MVATQHRYPILPPRTRRHKSPVTHLLVPPHPTTLTASYPGQLAPTHLLRHRPSHRYPTRMYTPLFPHCHYPLPPAPPTPLPPLLHTLQHVTIMKTRIRLGHVPPF